MKILMQNRKTAFLQMGGDTVQMMKTKEYLEKIGINVDISLDVEPDVRGYDLVHVFNIQDCAAEYSYHQIVNAKKSGIPIALSPIYWKWDNSEINGFIRKYMGDSVNSTISSRINKVVEKYFKIKVNKVISISEDMERVRNETRRTYIKSHQESSLLLIDGIFPNAAGEWKLIENNFGINIKNVCVVPNAVEGFFGACEKNAQNNKKGYVLSVGRISPEKNQLGLIEAMKKCDIPIVFVGGKSAPLYYDICKKRATENMRFIDEVQHDELRDLYANASVHALPSWRETPGLVNLEAGLAGCNLVITKRGTTEEYFKDMAWYCDPNDTDSIKKAVLDAYNAPRNDNLRKHIEKNFTWKEAAKKTLEGYEKILEDLQ